MLYFIISALLFVLSFLAGMLGLGVAFIATPILGQQEPRADVGVVVHPGDHDLVARPRGAADREGQGGHGRAKNDLVGRGGAQPVMASITACGTCVPPGLSRKTAG
jgi:hypothetical protein